MRGEIVYRVYGLHEGRAEDSHQGTFRTRAEAEAAIARLDTQELNGANWAQRYHNRGFEIRETKVETDFEIPPRPTPRERYSFSVTPKPNRPGVLSSTTVQVLRRMPSGEDETVCSYERDYPSMLRTFEPFRQGMREFALISRHYENSEVLDLASGRVIATESGGFCPAGFYVPDWWDIHDGSIIPGSPYWNSDKEWPTAQFGFVWGCVWGDDSSWKVQYLDLSEVQNGVLRRDERFGYVELATGFDSLASPKEIIRPVRFEGRTTVTFAVEMEFDLASGKPREWQRLKIANFE